MDGDVPRFRGEGHDRQNVGLIGPRQARDPPVRAGDHEKLPGRGGRRVELDPDVQHGAFDRVTAHAAVAMPRQVRQA